MKRLFIIMAIAAVMILSGCEGSGDGSSDVEPPVYYGGTQGVIANFEVMGTDVNGVQTVWEGEEFPVEITVKNKGEEDISPGDLNVTIQGIDTKMFGIDDPVKSNQEELEKVSEYNERGGQETISFGNAMLEDVGGLTHEADFFATVKYDYKTYVSVPSVCFKGDYRDDSLCKLDEKKEVFASGAPLTVKKVKQQPGGSKQITLIFNVENVGGGEVARPGKEFNSMHNKFEFEMTEGNDENVGFDCSSSGSGNVSRLNDGKAKIRCKSDQLDKDDLYTKQVTLELSYKYKDIIQKSLVIRDNPQED
ncbi:MAG: hypothetical protein ACQEP1_02105 [Nanobdellota archaeon]